MTQPHLNHSQVDLISTRSVGPWHLLLYFETVQNQLNKPSFPLEGYPFPTFQICPP